MGMVEKLIHDATEAIADADCVRAVDLVREWAEVYGYDNLAEVALIPILKQFNDTFVDSGEVPLARAYVAGKFAERVMALIAGRVPRTNGEFSRGPVVIGNIEDDFHALGRRILANFLRADGWDVCDLGNDVPAIEFVDKAIEIGARVIGASAMMYTTAQNIIGLRGEIDRRGYGGRIQLAVGGAIFILRPELVQELGGDGTARTASTASELFERLWAKTE